MKQFLKFFVLEFVIIFVVAAGIYRIVGVPFSVVPVTISSAVSGAIIAYAMVKTRWGACK